MANLQVKDAAATTQEVKATGVGSAGDPFIVEHLETNSAAILADTANMDTNLATLAGAVTGTEFQVDLVSGNVTNAGTFVVQIDGAALTALQLLDNQMRVEDEASADAHAGSVALVVRDDTLAANAGVTADGDYTFFRVNNNGALWVAADGTFTVDGSGVTQPVSGTVTETNSAAILADTANMDTNLGTVAGAVAAGQMQVDIVADGAGLLTTSAHDAAFGTAGTADAQVRTVQGIASMTPLLVDATGQGDVPITLAGEEVTVNLGTVDNGVLDNIDAQTAGSETALELIDGAIVGPGEPSIDSYTQASINLAAAANQVLVSSAANKQIWVYGIGFVLSAAGTVSFQDEDDTAITGIMPFAANSGMEIDPSGNFAMPMWKLGTDKDLEVDIVTAEVDGWVTYAIVSV